MFGRKKKKNINKKKKNSADMHVMPEDFYGGKDPVIHYQKTGSTGSVSTSIKTVTKDSKSIKSSRGFNLSNLLKNKKVVYIGGGVVSVVVITLISLYYLNQAGLLGNKEVKQVVEEKTTEVVVNSSEDQVDVVEDIDDEIEDTVDFPSTDTDQVVTSTEGDISTPTTTPTVEEEMIDFPSILLADSVDLDSDSLTDLEEEVFNTDSGTWDTDNDGYYDGQEVYNLYNPRGLAPVRLVDSGLVREYINPAWQYRIYYPLTWQAANVDKNYRQVLFSTITGDFVELSVFQKNLDESFEDWFARRAKDQKYSDLQEFTNLFEEDCLKRKDDLVAYFEQGNNIYVLIYHPGTTNSVPFRNVVKMMVQSFRPDKTLINIPDQPILPEPVVEDMTTSSDNLDNEDVATSTEDVEF